MSKPKIVITSFGYLHGEAPAADITLDLRRHFRDPHFIPELKYRTARSQAVRDAVLATPGISALIAATVAAAQAYLAGPSAAEHALRIAAGCSGGRHRAATVAEHLCVELLALGFDVRVEHRDLDKPVVERRDVTTTVPRRVCLCGSTRFRSEFDAAGRALTLAGCIVLAPGVFVHGDGTAVTEQEKTALDALHLAKIDLADEVFVINPGGYIGASTANEIAYATRRGTPVRYLVQAQAEA